MYNYLPYIGPYKRETKEDVYMKRVQCYSYRSHSTL